MARSPRADIPGRPARRWVHGSRTTSREEAAAWAARIAKAGRCSKNCESFSSIRSHEHVAPREGRFALCAAAADVERQTHLTTEGPHMHTVGEALPASGNFTMLGYLDGLDGCFARANVGLPPRQIGPWFLGHRSREGELLLPQQIELKASTRWSAGAMPEPGSPSLRELESLLSERGQDVALLRAKVCSFFARRGRNTPARSCLQPRTKPACSTQEQKPLPWASAAVFPSSISPSRSASLWCASGEHCEVQSLHRADGPVLNALAFK